ncbi:MAG: hypothetical protein AAFZ46_17885, partial [Pseudomonadota bacterium]
VDNSLVIVIGNLPVFMPVLASGLTLVSLHKRIDAQFLRVIKKKLVAARCLQPAVAKELFEKPHES